MTWLSRLVDFLAAEPVRVAALLRPLMIALIVTIVDVGDVKHWLPAVYHSTITAYFVASLVWLLVVLRGTVPDWAGWVSTSIDVLAVVTLCLSSGGATAWLLPVFFLLPVSVAFENRPGLTAALGAVSAFAYLGVWIVYSKRDDTVGLPDIVYLHFAFLLWFAAATTGLSLVLSRRAARMAALLDARKRLVSESMRADERHSRELAESLHDGPLQELLASRLELDELSERVNDPGLDAVRSTLAGTATQLRSALRNLHPAVLSELGLTPALSELLQQCRDRGLDVDAELEAVGMPHTQDVLFRAARELLGNVARHADAATVWVALRQAGETITLVVRDDGIGFDPSILDRWIGDGHIGLASLVARVEAVGGSVDIRSAVGRGTQVTVVTHS